MKRRVTALLLLCVMLFGMAGTVHGANAGAQNAAKTLYELGLFSGTGTDANGNPVFELDRAPTRHEAATMLVSLLGKKQEAQSGTWKIPFTDVADWARPFVGYAYANGLTSGTSATTYSGNDLISAAQYLTFVLKVLGYEAGKDFQWDKAWVLSDKIGLTHGEYNAKTAFTRGDVAEISLSALSICQKGTQTTLGQKLGFEVPASAPSTPKPTTPQGLLNAATLTPMKTNDETLDAMVEDILRQILTDGMSNYDKVKACYDYLKKNTVYQTKNEATEIRGGVYNSWVDYKNVILATEVLSTGKGVCDHYAAAFHVLTRRIGLESYICVGQHLSQKGGMGGHVWNSITLDGTDYIFDAQIDDLGSGGYNRFLKTFAQMGTKYQDYNIAQSKAEFGGFQRASSSGSNSGGSLTLTPIQEFIFSDPRLMELASLSIEYSELVAAAATQLRAEYGVPPMRADSGAAMVAFFCAVGSSMGDTFSNEEIAYFMLDEGVDFRYVAAVPMSGFVDPEVLVWEEAAAFANPDIEGIGMGFYNNEWVILFYGG